MSVQSTKIPFPSVDDGAIWRIWLSFFHAPCLVIADELGIFRELREGGATASELTERISIELRAMETILALLCSLEVLEHAGGRFYLNEVSRQCLLPESPYYWGGILRRIRDTPTDLRVLLASLRAGGDEAAGRIGRHWESKSPPPEFLRTFTHAMHAHSFTLAMRVIPLFDLAGGRRMLDAGGGSGAYSIAAALHDSDVRCTVLDFAPVCEVAEEYIEKAGVSDRVKAAVGDLFIGPWPEGHDCVLFNNIFHDWDDERCLVMSKHAFDALPRGGRVLVHEMLLSDAKDGPLLAAAYSMVMIFAARGRQRTAGELSELLQTVGFSDVRLRPTAGGFALVEARKP